MSTSEKDVNPEANTDASSEEPIIEAEIIEEAETTTATKSSPPVAEEMLEVKKGAGGKVGWWLAIILMAFIGGLFAAPYAEKSLIDLGLLPKAEERPEASAGHDVSALENTVAGIQTELNKLSQQVAANQTGGSATESSTNQRISVIEDDLSRLSGVVANAQSGGGKPSENTDALEAEISRLSYDVARLSGLVGTEAPGLDAVNSSVAIMRAEANQLRSDVTALRVALSAIQSGSIEGSPRGRLILALGRIENIALNGQAFDTDLESLRADTSDLPAFDQQKIGAHIAALEPHASGIVPVQSLLRAFPDVASKAKLASEKESGSFLASLFTVRRTDGHASGVDAVLLTAEKRLVLGDLEGTIEALDTLEGDARDTVKEWRDNAASYLAVQNAFGAFRQTVARAANANAGGSE